MEDLTTGNLITAAVSIFIAGGVWVRVEMLGKNNKASIDKLEAENTKQWEFITGVKDAIAGLSTNIAVILEKLESNGALAAVTQRQVSDHAKIMSKFNERTGERMEAIEKEFVHVATIVESNRKENK